MTSQTGQYVIKSKWMHLDSLEQFLKDFIGSDSCLNYCSGYSMIGNVRVDKNGQSWRTKEGDLFNAKNEFEDNSFDWVYCDPPFEFYTSGENRIRWQLALFDIAKKGLITRRPKVVVRMKSKRHEYYIIEDGRLSLDLLRIDYH